MQDTNTAFEAPLPVEISVEKFPQQDLWRFDQRSRRDVRLDKRAVLRRIFVFLGTALLTAYLTRELCLVFAVGGYAELELVLIGLFVLNIAWLSLSFMTALSGFLVFVLGLKKSIVPIPTDEEAKALPEGRTAILVATYNELPERIFGMALATMKELETSGHGESFDVFILSDTTDPDIWVHEEAAFNAARSRPGTGPRLYYRRRATNTGKKAGNIADWCRRWGPAYDYMIVLDADSLMTGYSLVKLAHCMDRMPGAGLIQTVPATIGRNTLFARMQQFAGGVYGPVMATGLAFWHRGTGNFWGHNAIIRVRAFMELAGLPLLPGSPPFGGQILSHDFVEAALMCRAGWRVCMVPELKGSYEETPPSLIDFATRDRRWCQGNLQHSMILGAKGLRPMSRVHLAMGIMAYVSALIWLIFLVTALMLTVQQLTAKPIYFGGDQTLFPTWPMQDSERALSLLFWTLALLLLPKLFSFLVALFNGAKRRGFGGVLGAGQRRRDGDDPVLACRPCDDDRAVGGHLRHHSRPRQRLEPAAAGRRLAAGELGDALPSPAHGARHRARHLHLLDVSAAVSVAAAGDAGSRLFRAAFGRLGDPQMGRALQSSRHLRHSRGTTAAGNPDFRAPPRRTACAGFLETRSDLSTRAGPAASPSAPPAYRASAGDPRGTDFAESCRRTRQARNFCRSSGTAAAFEAE